MNWRASNTGNWPANSLLILVVFYIFLSAGCAFKTPWRDKFSRFEDIPPATESAMWLDYERALAVSRETGKPVVLFFTGSDWCSWCVRLQEEVFETDEFRYWAAENVTMVDVDFPQESRLPGDQRVLNETLKKTYERHIKGFPTALFIDSNGTVIGKLGYEKGGPKSWISKAEMFVNSDTY